MIRINLLPFRLARKKENIRRQISVFCLSIVFIFAGLAWGTMYIDKQIVRVKQDTARVNTQISLYKERADRVSQIKKDLKTLKDKLKIVSSLKTKRRVQLTLLEEVADRVVPERMWLDSLTADSGKVTIKGIAFDNPTIADFMRNLEGSALFSGIDLKRSKTQTFKGSIDLKSFEIICTKKVAQADPSVGKNSKKKGK